MAPREPRSGSRQTVRGAPRQSVHGKVVPATDFPPEPRIGPHQEMSYHSHPPRHIAFFCDLEPTEGGQTPLTDMRSVYQRVNPQVRDRFESKGVRTIRRLPGKKRYAPSKVFLNRTWQEVLLVSDKKGAERVIKEWGWQGRWVGDDDLIIRQNPGVGTTVHPDTRDPVWFNQAPTQHRRLLTWQPFQAGFYKAWLMAKLDQWLHPERPRVHMEHNDGSPLRMSDLDHVKKILKEETVMFDWCKGDTLLVDNILTGHGRMPYKGPRRIYVALLDRFKI